MSWGDPSAPHGPSDGTPGTVVGDDTLTLPAIRPARKWPPWWLPFLILAALIIVAAILLAATAT